MSNEKKASNFELNIIKLGVNTFQLSKGDRFESNGAYFNYEPIAKENKGKGKRVRYSGRSNSISAKKYWKDVERADNIKLITDKYSYTDSQGNEHRHKIWEVQYAYKVELDENEKLIILYISLGRFSEKEWQFKSDELPVKRVTKETLFLDGIGNPVTYHSQIAKDTLNIVHTHYNTQYIMCYADDIQESEIKLFKMVEELQRSRIDSAKQAVINETENLNKFQLLKEKYGY